MLLNGKLELENLSSDPSSPTEGMMYYNSTDKKVKVYNGSSFDDLGGGSALWYHDSSAYTVYDDFESYGTGTFTTNAKWTVTLESTGTCTIESSTLSGGTGKEVKIYGTAATYTWRGAKVETNNLPADQTGYWFRFYMIDSHGAYNPDGDEEAYLIVNGTEYLIFNHENNQRAGAGINSTCLVYKNGSTYDVYYGGKAIVTGLSTITSLGAKVRAINDSGSGSSTQINMDDVRYIA